MGVSVRGHLIDLHEEAARHHSAMSEHHGALAKAAHGLAKCFSKAKEDGEEHSKFFTALAKGHEAAAVEHDASALTASQQAEACAKAVSADDLNKLVPSTISRVTPTPPNVRMVPRAGQPAVPEQFQKLFAVDEDSLYDTTG